MRNVNNPELYWCETGDHDEDWFVVARSARAARRLHEDLEGYARGDATSALVCRLPEGVCIDDGWPSDETLVACGARFVRSRSPRVVEVAGRTYAEGMLDAAIDQIHDDEFERRGRGRPNGTPRAGRLE